ncbi:hypothetical protein C7212DRAFT_167508, partial [Tuber magnatum]
FWGIQDWSQGILIDKCAFNVKGAPGRVWVTQRIDEKFDESCLVPKFKKLDSILVWASFVGYRKGPLITITAKGYQTHILPHLEQFWHNESTRTHDCVCIQHDNTSPHRACTTVTDLQDHGLYNYLLPWPATSPDLNLIEPVWRLMKSHISKLHPRPQNNKDMITAIRNEWNKIMDYKLGQILDMMLDRVDTILCANGGHTKY